MTGLEPATFRLEIERAIQFAPHGLLCYILSLNHIANTLNKYHRPKFADLTARFKIGPFGIYEDET